MNATLSLLFLLLMAVLLALGASLSHALDPRCPASTSISGAEESANITTVDYGWNYIKAYFFVHPDSDFKGVSLEAAGDGWRRDAWFMLENTCFPQNEEWWWLWARVERPLNTNNVLMLKVSAGKCSTQCKMKGHFPGDLRLIVMAHGPSRLRFTDPDPCTAVLITPGEYITQSCKNPPAPKPEALSLWWWGKKHTTTTTTTTLSPALDQRCPADTTISGGEEWANTTTVQERGEYHNKYLFVQPDPGFKGVSLVAAGDGWRHDAWFKLNNSCFPQDAQWWELSAYVEREKNNALLVFRVSVGECSLDCVREGRFPGDINVNLEAQGTSRWRLEDPGPCGIERHTVQWSSRISCIKPLVPKTTTTTTTKMTEVVTVAVVMIVVIIVVVVVAAVLVVAKRCIRQRGLRVPPWRELAASWGVGHKAAEPPRVAVVVPREPPQRGLAVSWGVGHKAAEPPRVAVVVPREPPQRGLAVSWGVGHKAAEPPRVAVVVPSEPPRRGLAPSWDVGHKGAEPPRVAVVVPREPPRQEPGYLYMGGKEDEEHIYEDMHALAPCQQYENLGFDDDLSPRRAPPGTPSGVTEDEENIYEVIDEPAPCSQDENVGRNDAAYQRHAPRGHPEGSRRTEGVPQ
ncbi:uncharacterized protein LOC126996788 [Eriocheir sinensis]|uniref:uncharacterized protein LOC126996788 n=1 Tax=Eriocheir sinensis TaxID=95602 RepID=UPI0021C9BE43|nr:uncharacterized protein LOC126996788 [Eriocheir sinensis]XP_050713583.1 uncharacterized protein LOC126996788 [Eriocheir sinensis]XP_050713584.1 uncharacterized protein LOC126996788 [Eriocheir sinensis]XP_050713585.1 uncharacterized protein LOC126996788 [Eriocheir sinensis]XP_050713586.1 uncharacterized protein LOC126996788 [Eriocheir sinensis]XP_050713587.1 uncharacterized protein LOC126996788 [Eriocheir sinensis]XP_050713588.1 uncharacterized protein LOC126996788 [Eriocheir sinensis]XP_0